MSRVVVIGATGHVGTYLVPRLVRAGHEVVALSRRGDRHDLLRRGLGPSAGNLDPDVWHRLATREHAGGSITTSIDRARAVLGYAPRYSSLEALTWLAANGHVEVE